MIVFAQIADIAPDWLRNMAIFVASAAVTTYYLKRTFTKSMPQPLAVELTRALHEQFASKQEFEKHVAHNTERHAQLFTSISNLDREVREKADERQEKLDTQFTFIRENIAEIKTELRLRKQV